MIKPLQNGEFLTNQLIWNMVFKQGLPDLKKGFCKGHQITDTNSIWSCVLLQDFKASSLQISPKTEWEGNQKKHRISMMDIANWVMICRISCDEYIVIKVYIWVQTHQMKMRTLVDDPSSTRRVHLRNTCHSWSVDTWWSLIDLLRWWHSLIHIFYPQKFSWWHFDGIFARKNH